MSEEIEISPEIDEEITRITKAMIDFVNDYEDDPVLAAGLAIKISLWFDEVFETGLRVGRGE